MNSKSPAQRKAPKPKTKPADNGIERQIEAAEEALAALEEELADPGACATPEKTAASARRHEQAKRTVDELYQRWERIAG